VSRCADTSSVPPLTQDHTVRYDNHPPTSNNQEDVRAKVAAEEAGSFHIGLPCFLAMFIPGRFVSPISWIIHKGKGRIIIDASTNFHHDDTGAPNAYIPPTETPGMAEKNPPVFYRTAIRRHAEHTWILRISHPREDILQHSDDINAALQHILYHPDLALVFGYIFMELVLIPVGKIFESRSAPA
jgi:hypothetical protein